MPSEFELIARYFTRQPGDDAVLVGVGDDCTLLQPAPGRCLAVSVDTSVVDVHFPAAAPAFAIGYRALAVSLSDLAAMGAEPRWCLMALTLETTGDPWLSEFSRGFYELCQQTGVSLVGGDITRGRLSIGVTVHGELPPGQALRRSGARAGDILAVTGSLGGGYGGLMAWQSGERNLDDPLLSKYLLPRPRVEAGVVLRSLATSAIDVSDGLLADLQHLCDASNVGATLDVAALPLTQGLVERLGPSEAQRAALGGGDDYELLVSLPAASLDEACQRLAEQGLALTPIGRFDETPGVRGVPDTLPAGWLHFQGETP